MLTFIFWRDVSKLFIWAETIISFLLSSFIVCIGGGDLVISGTGFGDVGAVVSLGDAVCEVKGHTDTEITCTIPEHAPGTFYVELTVTDKGFAETK